MSFPPLRDPRRPRDEEKKRDNGESLLQIAAVNWLRMAVPEIKRVWHVRNQYAENAIQGKQMKDQGVLAGVFDLHLIWAPREYGIIELKNPKYANPKYSPSQAEFAKGMDEAGWYDRHACCSSGEQIEAVIRKWGMRPLYSFPPTKGSKRNLLQQLAADALYGQY